jgi:hypothetical protein
MPVRRDKRNGKWRFQKLVHLPDGRRERISGTLDVNTKAAAETAERDAISALLNACRWGEAPDDDSPAFRAFVEKRWLPTYPGSVGNRGINDKPMGRRWLGCGLTEAYGSLIRQRTAQGGLPWPEEAAK